MISSMTGYGRAQQVFGGRDISVEFKSVNHRYFEFSARAPRPYGYLEEKLKSFAHQNIHRGKLDCGVIILSLQGAGAQVEVDHELARSYQRALRALSEDLKIPDDLTISALSRFGDIFLVRKSEEDEDEIWRGVEAVARQAMEKYLSMRHREGERLSRDIRGHLDAVERHLGAVEDRAPQIVEEYRTRLTAKLMEVLEDSGIDQQRILTEAAVFSERVAVAEETVRLSSHLSQFREFLTQGQPVGRKLDFLVQEMNREANTIGSKCQDLATTRHVLEIKSEMEKIREQIQNIE